MMNVKKMMVVAVLGVSTVSAYAASDNTYGERDAGHESSTRAARGEAGREQAMQDYIRAAGFEVLGASRPAGGAIEETVFVIRPVAGSRGEAVYGDEEKKGHDGKRHNDKDEHDQHS